MINSSNNVRMCLQHSLRKYVVSRSNIVVCSEKTYCSSSSSSNVNDEVLVSKFGNITSIGLNRPEKRNCVNSATAKKLTQAIRDFENDESAYIGVLYGKGGNFCAGFDLNELSTLDENSSLELEPGLGPMGPTRSFIKKPLIAAVSGYAVAGGLELALMCDMRIVEETALLGVLCRRFGVPLIDGGTVRLPALIGLSRALDLIMTGRIIQGKEALELGIANRLVACGTALGQAMNIAGSLLKFPQECLLADRKSAYNAMFSAKNLQEALDFENDNARHVIHKESIPGAKRFMSGAGKHGSLKGLSDTDYFDFI